MSKGQCTHCQGDDCYRHCYATTDGIHVADPTSASSPDGECLDGRILVDFACLHCHQAGALYVKREDITWD